MTSTYMLLLAFLVGVFAGLRSLTAPAATAWSAHLRWLSLQSPLAWLGSWPAAVLFTSLALGELVADKLPKTPSRTAPPGLIAPVLLGAIRRCGLFCRLQIKGYGPAPAAGAIEGIVGCFLGYQVRRRLVKALGWPDFVVAVTEDLAAIGGSLWAVSRF
jgi:uncharacterized membrane protein